MQTMLYRQGDVMFKRVAELPQGKPMTKRENGTAAYGEVTGHSHRLAPGNMATAEVLEFGAGADLFVRVSEDGISLAGDPGASFVHEEHGAIHLPPGNYQVQIQREYTPEAIRNVLD